MQSLGSPLREISSLLKEQLEPKLIVLRGGEPSIGQVIEPDQEPAGVGTQGSADDGAREAAHERAKDKWAYTKSGRLLSGHDFQVAPRTSIG